MNLPMQPSRQQTREQSVPSAAPAEICFSVVAAPAGSAMRLRREALVRTIEDQIVPRLLVARTPPDMCPPPGDVAPAPPSQTVLDLVALAMGNDEDAVRLRIVEAAGHVTLEVLCLNLLQPAARQLGEMWMEDLASFTDVTIGMLRLHEGLNAVTGLARDTVQEGRRRHRILLAPAPGDDHRFGLAMVGAFFQQAGWMVTTAHQESIGDIEAMLRRDWYGVFGVSVSAEAHLAPLAAALPRLRAASRNSTIPVLVGGPVFIARPELVQKIGADAMASDGVQATWVAENMLAGRPPYS
jgi:methanogenic corrinoid protein MtbC1